MNAPVPAAPKPRPRRWLALAKGVFAVVWALLFFELFVRTFRPVPLMPRHVGRTAYGLRGNVPGMSYWQRTRDVQVNIRINARGIRADREIPYAKTPGMKRIVALGDSYMMGYEVDLRDTFLAQLERRLNDSGIRCETVNLSVSGYSNAEELLTLRREGARYQPDLVLLQWHDSDLDDNVRCGLFALRGDSLVQRDSVYLPGVDIAERLARIPFYSWLDENSHAYTVVREKGTILVKETLTWLRGASADPRKREAEKAAAAAAAAAAGVAAPVDSGPNPNERLSAALLRRIRDESAASGAPFVVVDIPRRFTRADLRSYFPWKDAEGLDVVDMLPAFRRHSGELLYWENGHSHLTPLGCRIVADELAKRILDEGLLAP